MGILTVSSYFLHRYIRTTEELQRVEISDFAREEKLAFFINLYNMMAVHAIVTCGHPAGPLDRKKFFGDFKYVIGGCAYSLSAIENGILRGNQRPPYNLVKPFGQKDQRSKVNKAVLSEKGEHICICLLEICAIMMTTRLVLFFLAFVIYICMRRCVQKEVFEQLNC
jgi:hypothetical protein